MDQRHFVRLQTWLEFTLRACNALGDAFGIAQNLRTLVSMICTELRLANVGTWQDSTMTRMLLDHVPTQADVRCPHIAQDSIRNVASPITDFIGSDLLADHAAICVAANRVVQVAASFAHEVATDFLGPFNSEFGARSCLWPILSAAPSSERSPLDRRRAFLHLRKVAVAHG